MRFAFGILLSGAVLSLVTGCGKKDSTGSTPEPSGPTLNIEGRYLSIGLERGGEPFPEALKPPEDERRIEFSGGKMIASKGMGETMEYKIDATKSPAHIDIVAKKPNRPANKMSGIVKLEGDTLTIFIGDDQKPEDRPKEFKTSKGDNRTLMTLKKQK